MEGATAHGADSKIRELLAVVSHEHYLPLCVNDATLRDAPLDVRVQSAPGIESVKEITTWRLLYTRFAFR